MEKVARNSCALRLPIEPYSSCAVVEMVVLYGNVKGGVKLNSANLGTREISLVVNMMNVVVLNSRENAAKIADDTRLTAIVDFTVANGVRADGFLAPPVNLRYTRAVSLGL